MDGRCTIDGTILQLIFQNEENGYTVLRLVTTDGEAVTVVGTIPCAARTVWSSVLGSGPCKL